MQSTFLRRVLLGVVGICILGLSFWLTFGALEHNEAPRDDSRTSQTGKPEQKGNPVLACSVDEAIRKRANDSATRDAIRRQDVNLLQVALENYARDNGTYLVKGGGSGGLGIGAVNLKYPDSKPIVDVLCEMNYLRTRTRDPLEGADYMLYLCENGKDYSISATLERPTDAEVSHAQTTCNAVGPNGTFTVYGKNYSVGPNPELARSSKP